MRVPLIFHFNQHLVEFAQGASQVCYRGLLRTLLDAPVKANIHISGTLVQALKWFDPVPLDLIRSGLENGQFEILGSTHAQNILISSDDWDNREQIRLHREILSDTFGVEPTAFWNPERCWRQPLVGLLARHGYLQATVEDHILEKSGAGKRRVYQTEWEGYQIQVVRDDEIFKHLFNFGAWFARRARLHAYLDTINAEDPEAVFAYGEDAEAMGLWGYSVDVISEQTWDRLAILLNELAGRNDFEAVLCQDLPAPEENLESIAEGSAAWMDASLRQTDLPYHEDGYENWFHFNQTSEKLAAARRTYTRIRETLQAAPAGEPLNRLARHTFLTHQYEFGCIGIGRPGSRLWSGAWAAISLTRLAGAVEGITIEDWNDDGEEEILVRSGNLAAVITATSARLLYLADLTDGRLIIGNPSSVSPGMFVRESVPPDTTYPRPDPRRPVDDYTQYDQTAQPPTAMRRFLPDWIWTRPTPELTLAIAKLDTFELGSRTLLAQQGAFLDSITLDGNLCSHHQVFRRDGLSFQADLGPNISLKKDYSFRENSVTVTYRLSGNAPGRVEIVTGFEISGDYAENLRSGREALHILQLDGRPAVRTGAGNTIRVESSLQNAVLDHQQGFHALTLVHRAAFEGLENHPPSFTIALALD